MIFPRRQDDERTATAPREVPPIDLQVPENLQTATFGSG